MQLSDKLGRRRDDQQMLARWSWNRSRCRLLIGAPSDGARGYSVRS